MGGFFLFESFIKLKGDKYRVRTEQLKDSGRRKKTWFSIYRTSAKLGWRVGVYSASEWQEQQSVLI